MQYSRCTWVCGGSDFSNGQIQVLLATGGECRKRRYDIKKASCNYLQDANYILFMCALALHQLAYNFITLVFDGHKVDAGSL